MMEFRDRILRRQSGTGHKNLPLSKGEIRSGSQIFSALPWDDAFSWNSWRFLL